MKINLSDKKDTYGSASAAEEIAEAIDRTYQNLTTIISSKN